MQINNKDNREESSQSEIINLYAFKSIFYALIAICSQTVIFMTEDYNRWFYLEENQSKIQYE